MSLINLSSDPALWGFAALLVGALFSIVLATFALMHAFVRSPAPPKKTQQNI